MEETKGPFPSKLALRQQRVVGTRRQYNQWVNNQTLEDYALRFTAHSARRWTPWWVANTAMGSIAFLACEAIGASVTINYGFVTTTLALAAAAAIFVFSGIPIAYYGARYGVDMDLLTRGAGFGYLGSTITSAVYASFTFILFAIEAIILSAALELCFGLPLALGHIISALIIIPIAAYGFRRISQWQNWTQPVWLLLQLAPLLFIFTVNDNSLSTWSAFQGQVAGNSMLNIGMALAIFLSLLPQIGEQVDYLRFLPARAKIGSPSWWTALLVTGPGWIVMGAFKILIGSCLAVLALGFAMDATDAANPTLLYYMTFGGLVGTGTPALVLTGLFVAVCQVKINLTNAYAGSIASSNFFSRLTHRHPGRVVWLVFNVLIALMLMEGDIQNVVEKVLTLYSNFAVAWIGAVTADLIISKPLRLSPPGIEFRRAYLHDINPVGVGAMALSLIASTVCFWGYLGDACQAFSPIVGLGISFFAAPLLAWATGGRYYIARPADSLNENQLHCTVCENHFEAPDMAYCPVYAGSICSLCCTLEARCHDACKETAQPFWRAFSAWKRIAPAFSADPRFAPIIRFIITFVAISSALSLFLVLLFYGQSTDQLLTSDTLHFLRSAWIGVLLITGFVTWYFLLARESRLAAEEESDRQTHMLLDEIEAHARTDAQLQKAKEVAEAANLAKSRYIIGVSHEIRTPLNTILGYAQLAEKYPDRYVLDAIQVIRRSATHLADLVEGLVDVSRIENGSLRLDRKLINLPALLHEIIDMFRLQAVARGIRFEHDLPTHLPTFIYCDEKRLRQVLINLISNAIKYTPSGTASVNVRWRDPVAEFDIVDTGVGIAEADINRIFEPFERIETLHDVQGVGLGLTITRMLVEIMGGQLTVESQPGAGSTFRVKLFLSEAVSQQPAELPAMPPIAPVVKHRKILAADDDPDHLNLINAILTPQGHDLHFAQNGQECLNLFKRCNPDLVILDISMPGMDGWETACKLRAMAGADVPIMMISANVHDFQRARQPDDPHDDYLIKPYDVRVLLERVETLLSLSDGGTT